jgi:hypothetical protein
MAKVIVHHFKEVWLKVLGDKYHVSSVNLVLRENAIPTARIIIDPAHKGNIPAVGTFDSPDAIAATLDRIVAWHEKFQEWSVKKEEATFNMEVWVKDNPDEPGEGTKEQELKLEDWVITGSGITGASASGNFALEIEISHPFVRTDFAPATLTSFIPMAKWDTSDVSGWDNPVVALQEILDNYAELDTISSQDTKSNPECAPEGPDHDTIRDALRTYVKFAAKTVSEYLVWKPNEYKLRGSYSDWPMEDTCLTDYVPWVKRALCDYITGNPDATPYEIIVGTMNPDWGLVLVPTFWKKELELRPYSPWLDPMVYLSSINISDLVFPGTDPAPIAGVIKQHQSLASAGDWSVYMKKGQDEAFIGDEVAYMPQKMVGSDGKYWMGRVLHLAPAQWIGQVGTKHAGSFGSQNNMNPAEANNKRQTPANNSNGPTSDVEEATPAMAHDLEQIRGAVRRDAKQTFMTKFRDGVECAVTCRLLMQYKKSEIDPTGSPAMGWIIPGHVYRILDTEFLRIFGFSIPINEPVFDFYCTDVLHSIDCQSGRVATELQGKYVRPMLSKTSPDSGYTDIVKSGDMNPLWET